MEFPDDFFGGDGKETNFAHFVKVSIIFISTNSKKMYVWKDNKRVVISKFARMCEHVIMTSSHMMTHKTHTYTTSTWRRRFTKNIYERATKLAY